MHLPHPPLDPPLFTCCAIGKRFLAILPHVGEVDKWPVSDLIVVLRPLSHDTRIIMQLYACTS